MNVNITSRSDGHNSRTEAPNREVNTEKYNLSEKKRDNSIPC